MIKIFKILNGYSKPSKDGFIQEAAAGFSVDYTSQYGQVGKSRTWGGFPPAWVNLQWWMLISFDTSFLGNKILQEVVFRFFRILSGTHDVEIGLYLAHDIISDPLAIGDEMNFNEKITGFMMKEYSDTDKVYEVKIDPAKINLKGYTDFLFKPEWGFVDNWADFWSIATNENDDVIKRPLLELKCSYDTTIAKGE